MRTRTAGFSSDLGLVAALGLLALGLWIALAVVTNGRALSPSIPGIAPLPEIPTTQPAPTNAAPPPSAGPANTNEQLSPAPNPAQGGSGTQPTGPGQIDPAQADPYPPKPKFDEPIDPPITNVKPIRIGEDK